MINVDIGTKGFYSIKVATYFPGYFLVSFQDFFFRSRKILNKNMISNNQLWKTSASRSWGEWQEVFIISCSVTPQLKHNAYEQPSRFLFSDHTSFRDFRSVLFCRRWFRDGHLLEICLNDYKISKNKYLTRIIFFLVIFREVSV